MELNNVKTAAILAAYNAAIVDYGVTGFEPIEHAKSKSAAIEKLEALCDAGQLSVTLNDAGDIIVADATPEAPEAPTHNADWLNVGDGKGAVTFNGFRYASDAWLKANARGTAARETYRDMRKLANKGHRLNSDGKVVDSEGNVGKTYTRR